MWWRRVAEPEKVDDMAAMSLAFSLAFGQVAARHFFRDPTRVDIAKKEVDHILTICIAEAEQKLGVGAASAAVTEVLNETMLNLKRELDDFSREASAR
jgi:hypothetical protein